MIASGQGLPEAMAHPITSPLPPPAKSGDQSRWARLDVSPQAPRPHSQRYTGIVRLLKVLLPAAAIAIAGLVAFWPQLHSGTGRFRFSSVSIGPEDLENLRMVNPRYTGLDSANQPYTVTAELATQRAVGAEVANLELPSGDIVLTDGAWVWVSADKGVYRHQAHQLELRGHVDLFHDRGYEIHTSMARVDLNAGSAEGDQPIQGHGPDVELSGQGFRIDNRGARMTLLGPARIKLYGAKTEGSK